MSNEKNRVTGTINISGAKLIFRNFQGSESTYNKRGDRNFGVLLDDDLAEQLKADGWNVKYRKPREDDPEQYRQPWLKVIVKFEKYPPNIVLIKSNGKLKLDEDTIDQLDWSTIKNCDLIITPYNYPEMPGRPAGVSAYLKALYVTIEEDAFEDKYADLDYLN